MAFVIEMQIEMQVCSMQAGAAMAAEEGADSAVKGNAGRFL